MSASVSRNMRPKAPNQTATRTIIAQKSTATREARWRLKMIAASMRSAAATSSHGAAWGVQSMGGGSVPRRVVRVLLVSVRLGHEDYVEGPSHHSAGDSGEHGAAAGH